ncbi:PaaI family thioesterase [Desulfonema ishimotonii]|uniref:PaaI family thioesterase n=1 Tax=Desulfonema ishimotonii TaxID=45657 RepID=A0A401FY21_9BACT|nr:PaaI family thioesterase [Desulfonema ishimotonii]GBC61878.1 PaaI family thioesterase [Desulfonema ishimotonii]
METFRKEFIQKDIFARHAGIELINVSPGQAIARMKISEKHMNGAGVVQGGAIFTLADLAFAAASNSHGTAALGINATISFLKAGGTGTLTAEAREISRTNRLATYSVQITDDDGDVVAAFQGTVYRKRERR